MPAKLRIESFLKMARECHGDRYDYSLIHHVYARKKVSILCPTHGVFEQAPAKHLEGQGCPQCAGARRGNSSRHTRHDFIARASAIHGTRYDYSQVDYKSNHIPVTIICPQHGAFQQTPGNHTHKTNPQGCPSCGGRTKWTTDRFLTESRNIHGNRYDYSKVVCKTATEAVVIGCPTHGDFCQDAMHHIGRRQGCPNCASTKKSNTPEFVQKAQAIHGTKYDYSKTQYISNHKAVSIVCPQHGVFLQTPANHTNKRHAQGCPRCTGRLPWTVERFLAKAVHVHRDLYDYQSLEWKGFKKSVTILCPYHGDFSQLPPVHLSGSGCPRCASSHGESFVRTFLLEQSITFTEQKSFPDCIDKRPLPFDFHVSHSGKEYLIEYHGAQHYGPVSFGGKKTSQPELQANFEAFQKRDEIKCSWCAKNKLPLLVIPHTATDNEIIDKLCAFLQVTHASPKPKMAETT